MKLKELKEKIKETNNVEVHKNNFKIMCNFVKINNIVLRNINNIKIIDKTVWFDDNHIQLENIKSLHISKVRSYL